MLFYMFSVCFPNIWPLAGPNIAKKGGPLQKLARGNQPQRLKPAFSIFFSALFLNIWPLAGPNIAKKGGPLQKLARVDRQTHFGTFDFWIKPGFWCFWLKKAIFPSFFHDFFAGFWAVYLNFPSFFAGPGPGPGGDRARAWARGLRRRMENVFFSARVFQAVLQEF